MGHQVMEAVPMEILMCTLKLRRFEQFMLLRSLDEFDGLFDDKKGKDLILTRLITLCHMWIRMLLRHLYKRRG